MAITPKGNNDMTKAQAISKMILDNIAKGMKPREAVDAVLGEGTFEGLAADVYDALNG